MAEYHRHILAMISMEEHIERRQMGLGPRYEYCPICDKVPTQLVAETPEDKERAPARSK